MPPSPDTVAAGGQRSAARAQMLDVAERLFAERGIDGVSLRTVGQSAGQRNNSAAQYHFGSRDGLVQAVVERRFESVDERRRELTDTLGTDTSLRELVRCVVLPLAELVDTGSADQPTWYVRFLAQLVALNGGYGAEEITGPPTGLRRLESRMRTHLAHLDRATYVRRQRWFAQTMVRVLADQEHERAAGRPAVAIDVIVDDLVTMLVALLEAP